MNRLLENSEITTLENEVDLYFAELILPAPFRSASIWHLVTVMEDFFRIRIIRNQDQGPESYVFLFRELGVAIDLYKYAYKYSLLNIIQRQLPHSISSAYPILDQDAYGKAHTLISSNVNYDAISRALSSYHEGRMNCHLNEKTETILFGYKIDDRVYDVLDFLDNLQGEKLPMHLFLAMCLLNRDMLPPSFLGVIQRTELHLGSYIKYKFKLPIALELHQLLSETSTPPEFVSESWIFPWGDVKVFRSILFALQIRCLYHVLAVHYGALKLRLDGFGVESLCFVIRLPELVHDIANLSGHDTDTVRDLLQYFIYGHLVDTPDPILQPLVRVSNKLVLISSFQLLSSNIERNALTHRSLVFRRFRIFCTYPLGEGNSAGIVA